MRSIALTALLTVVFSQLAWADDMPVREVTVFKDGHAFVLHEGAMPVNDAGHVVLDRLPAPVMGTFWADSHEKGAKLDVVRAGKRKVSLSRTALDLVDLITANVGAGVIVTDTSNRTFHARIAAVPTRSGTELEETAVPGTGAALPVRGRLVLFDTDEGLRAMPLNQVREVVFRDEVERMITQEEMRNRLTLELRWDGAPGETARVGMAYVQKGLRWIPNYQIDLQEDGTAIVRLQATLVNDLVDLHDVSANLVIGVPTFAFEHVVDPISLQAVVAQAARNMRQSAVSGQFLSNAIMTQMGRSSSGLASSGGAAPADTEVSGSSQLEDLYVFHVEHLTLAKGQRLVVAVAEVTLTYEDLYTLKVPFSPPPEVWPHIIQHMERNPQDAEAARLLASAKVIHEIRLKNKGPHPLTTAPALILRDGRVLAQGLLTYTSVGGTVDLPITTAVDVNINKEDRGIGKTPNVVRWSGNSYGKVEMSGTITLLNYKDETIHLEVERFVLGNVVSADTEGDITALNALEDMSWAKWQAPIWWRWYSWPYWWYHFNGAARVRWDVTLESGESIDLGYAWEYYWP